MQHARTRPLLKAPAYSGLSSRLSAALRRLSAALRRPPQLVNAVDPRGQLASTSSCATLRPSCPRFWSGMQLSTSWLARRAPRLSVLMFSRPRCYYDYDSGEPSEAP